MAEGFHKIKQMTNYFRLWAISLKKQTMQNEKHGKRLYEYHLVSKCFNTLFIRTCKNKLMNEKVKLIIQNNMEKNQELLYVVFKAWVNYTLRKSIQKFPPLLYCDSPI